ncbi:hypothetical protein OG883_14965 [Streptomyces sp. NBC_01142]|nr:hypothetical protein [Streptomyces sp. NBC_01142]MCX4821189.1 hypothetical protein [Streptomyces sp. NBC_01142]
MAHPLSFPQHLHRPTAVKAKITVTSDTAPPSVVSGALPWADEPFRRRA